MRSFLTPPIFASRWSFPESRNEPANEWRVNSRIVYPVNELRRKETVLFLYLCAILFRSMDSALWAGLYFCGDGREQWRGMKTIQIIPDDCYEFVELAD